MRNFILGFAFALALSGAAWWLLTSGALQHWAYSTSESGQQYHCPMHPTYVSNRQGDCPICGMRLVPIKDDTASRPGMSHDTQPPAPMRIDPETGMPMDDPSPVEVPGYTPVQISLERQQLMGIVFAQAEEVPLTPEIRTVGRVTADETRYTHIHTKFEGYLEKLYVNYVGQLVRQGDPIFTVYSPELYATQKEYLLALRWEEQFGQSPDTLTGPRIDLVQAARERLALWDITDADLEKLERTREPVRALTLYSPVTGFVTAKTAVEGLRLMPGDTLFEIVDLSSVWVQAEIYEIDLPFVRIGQRAEMISPYQPGRRYSGRVTYIDPTLDEQTRTVKARIEIPNPQLTLKPEMYGDVVIHGNLGSGVAVPDDAVITTGERNIVFVAGADGWLEPREVTLGVKLRRLYQIRSGIAAGERVVTGANFLLDSESRLKATLRAGTGDGHQHAQ